MKLEDVQDIETLERWGGIFQHLYRAYPEMKYLVNAVQLDYEYYLQHSGQKTLSPLFMKLYKFNEESIIGTYVQLVPIIKNKFSDKWKRLFEALVEIEYNPIHNYNMEERETQETEIKGTMSKSESVAGFNSLEPALANTSDTESTTSGASDNNVREHTKSGNIGVTLTQKMLESEIEVRKNNFYDILFKDVDSLIVLVVYD